jgi:hypothetical protein
VSKTGSLVLADRNTRNVHYFTGIPQSLTAVIAGPSVSLRTAHLAGWVSAKTVQRASIVEEDCYKQAAAILPRLPERGGRRQRNHTMGGQLQTADGRPTAPLIMHQLINI